MSFTLAVTGNAQNASYQTQYANALNGATAVSVALYNSTGVPLVLTTDGNTTSRALVCSLAGDTAPRGFATTWATNEGILVSQDQAGNILADLYNSPGTSNLGMAGNFTVNGNLTVTGGFTATGLSITNSPTFSGALSVSGPPINANASYLAPGVAFLCGSTYGGYLVGNNNGSGATWIGAQGPGGASRGFKFDTVNSSGTVTTNARTDVGGRLTLMRNGFNHANSGMYFSRISSASAAVAYHAPSYGMSTFSHGLGVQPDAGVATSGDGGAFTGDLLLGFDNMGSSSVEVWVTMSSGTSYVRFTCMKHSG